MMRLCQKINCNLPAIHRGKYCEIHRTNKRRTTINYQENIFEEENRRQIGEENKRRIEEENRRQIEIENDRKLRMEQEEEYKRSMEIDMKRNEEMEYEKMLELSLKEYYNDKKNKMKIEDTYYSIKIKLPDGDILVKNFGIDCSIGSLRDAIEIYFYEMKIKISEYQIVFNYPKRIFTKEDSYILISSLDVPKNFIIYVYNLDA